MACETQDDVYVISGDIREAPNDLPLPLRRLKSEEKLQIGRILCQGSRWRWIAFKLGLRGIWFPNPQYITTRPVEFHFDEHTFVIPKNYISDGSTYSLDSIGRPQWLCHDWMYSHKPLSKESADDVFQHVAPWRVIALRFYHWKSGDYCTTYSGGHVFTQCECPSDQQHK